MHPALEGGSIPLTLPGKPPQMSMTHYKPKSPCYTLDPQILFITLQIKVRAIS